MVTIMRGIVESERTKLACLDVGTHRVAWVVQPDGCIVAALFTLDIHGRTGECLSRVEVASKDVSRLSDALGAMAEGE